MVKKCCKKKYLSNNSDNLLLDVITSRTNFKNSECSKKCSLNKKCCGKNSPLEKKNIYRNKQMITNLKSRCCDRDLEFPTKVEEAINQVVDCPFLDIKEGKFIIFNSRITNDDILDKDMNIFEMPEGEEERLEYQKAIFFLSTLSSFKSKFIFKDEIGSNYETQYKLSSDNFLKTIPELEGEDGVRGAENFLFNERTVPLIRIDRKKLKYEFSMMFNIDNNLNFTLEYNNFNALINKLKLENKNYLYFNATSNTNYNLNKDRWYLIINFNNRNQSLKTILIMGFNTTEQCLTKFTNEIGIDFFMSFYADDDVNEDEFISFISIVKSFEKGEILGTVGEKEIRLYDYGFSLDCYKLEKMEEYVPGTRDSSGYVRSFNVLIKVPCARGGAPS